MSLLLSLMGELPLGLSPNVSQWTRHRRNLQFLALIMVFGVVVVDQRGNGQVVSIPYDVYPLLDVRVPPIRVVVRHMRLWIHRFAVSLCLLLSGVCKIPQSQPENLFRLEMSKSGRHLMRIHADIQEI